MCGIAGIFCYRSDWRPEDEALIKKMITVQKHRGPDASGIWSDREAGIYLAHARLKVIDLSDAANQPMISKDGRYVIVFNGEIYNFLLLRHKLEKEAGIVFRTKGDTEVLLTLYSIYGAACLSFLRGMFAFAIYDRVERTLFLARDRTGEKPLVYAVANGIFLFASEIKGILATDMMHTRLSLEGLAHYFAYNYCVPPPYTMFEGIYKLPPARYLTVSSYKGMGISETRRYWAPDFSKKFSYKSKKEASEHYVTLLREVVKTELVADVPVACMLSGGVDSSSIAALAASFKPDLRCYVLGRKEEDPEVEQAKLVAHAYHYPLEILGIGEEKGLINLEKAVRAYDEPYNVYPATYALELYGLIKSKGTTVVLSGNGADELFAGYTGYNDLLKRERIFAKLRAVGRLLGIEQIGKLLGGKFDLLGAMFSQDLSRRMVWGAERRKEKLSRRLLKRPELVLGIDVSKILKERVEESGAEHPLDAKLYLDLMVNHIHGTVMVADGCAMQHALEVRAPFLDHQIVEFAASLPIEYKLPDPNDPLRNKEVMKIAMESLLSQKVLYAKKMGFGYGINWPIWIRTVWHEEIKAILMDGWLRETGMFKMDEIAQLLEINRNEKSKSFHNIIWLILNLEIWGRNYMKEAII